MEERTKVNLTDLAGMVAKKTDYNKAQCYEVLRAAADVMGDVLVEGNELSISRLVNMRFEYGTCKTALTGDKEVPSVRLKCKMSDGLRSRAKEAM